MTSFTKYPSEAQFAQMGRQMYTFVLEHQRSLDQVSRESNYVQPSCSANYTPVFNRRLFSYVMGIAGLTSLVASCIASMLVPAIGSVGMIGIACLLKRKVAVLRSGELPALANKSQKVIKENTLPSATASHSSNLQSSPLEMHSTSQEEVLSIPNTRSTQRPSSKIFTMPLPQPTSLEEIEELLKSKPRTYTTNLLVKELKATYERMLEICKVTNPLSKPKVHRTWKEYFAKKIKDFEQHFALLEQAEDFDEQVIFEITRGLHSLTENMKWTRVLLNILSERSDLKDEAKTHCRKKATTIVKHIEKLEAEELEPYKEQQSLAMGNISQSVPIDAGSHAVACELPLSNVTNIPLPPPTPPMPPMPAVTQDRAKLLEAIRTRPVLKVVADSQKSGGSKETQPSGSVAEAMKKAIETRYSCMANSSPDSTDNEEEQDFD